MKTSHAAKLAVIALAFASQAGAQQPAAPAASAADAPTKPAVAVENKEAASKPGEAGAKVEPKKKSSTDKPDKSDEENRLKIEFDEASRTLSAFYPNSSQARLKVYSANRYDAEIAKPREFFLVEMTGTAIVEPLKLDVDDAESVSAVVSILERFAAESDKSGSLKEDMAKRKVDAEAELSREETKLVELQSVDAPDASAIESTKAKIEELKDSIVLAAEVGGMEKITGKMGVAKINLDRPAYDFQATFEPSKSLFTLSAGYSFQVAAKDAKYFIDLLKRSGEFKRELLAREAKSRKLKEQVESIFKPAKS